MEQHRDKTHIGQFTIVADTSTANSRHQVATKETEISFTVCIFQRSHQVRGMQVARGLADYQVVFHSAMVRVPNC